MKYIMEYIDIDINHVYDYKLISLDDTILWLKMYDCNYEAVNISNTAINVLFKLTGIRINMSKPKTVLLKPGDEILIFKLINKVSKDEVITVSWLRNNCEFRLLIRRK